MKKFLVLLFFLAANNLFADEIDLMSVPIHLKDLGSLQRGAKIYMNYCSGCHSLKYMRYNHLAKDLGLTTFTGEIDQNLLLNNLIFTRAKIQDPIVISMPKTDALQWFGKEPPDLSLKARERGADWLYTYLKSFYADDKRPFGSNNLIIPDVAMPNVFEPLIGKVIFIGKKSQTPSLDQLLLIAPGQMSEEQFDSMLEDLINFLVYVGEPVKLIRYRLGFFVLIFLTIFTLVVYQLKKSYWKKIH